MKMRDHHSRHCEERKRRSNPGLSPPSRPWIASLALAMTEATTTDVIPGRAQREPGISRHTSRFRIGPLSGPSGMTAKSRPSLRDGKR